MNQENDVQACKRLLEEIAEMCDHASLTGSLSTGAKRTAMRYNSILARLVDSGEVPEGLFGTLPDSADYGEIGVEARMLASYFRRDKSKDKRGDRDGGDANILMRLAPFVRQEELGMLIREQRLKGAPLDIHMVSNLAPFLGQDILSDLIREHMSTPNVVTPASPTPPTPPAVANPNVSPQPVSSPQPQVNSSDRTLQPVHANGDSLDDLLALLKSPYLSDEERLDLVERVRALSH
ncbi:MAG: hypothetical protein P4L46_03705 [Fimbriimonas sp.]|nr:hypothetical protein [Fimbriimonas sp.]